MGLQANTKLLHTTFYQFLIALYSTHICTMKNAQKKVLAKELYLSTELTLKEIAENVGVTANTIGKWCASWKQIKAAKTSTKDEVIARYMRMIDSILKIAEDEGRVITDGEADKISKLNKAKDSIDKGKFAGLVGAAGTEGMARYSTSTLSEPVLHDQSNSLQAKIRNFHSPSVKPVTVLLNPVCEPST